MFAEDSFFEERSVEWSSHMYRREYCILSGSVTDELRYMLSLLTRHPGAESNLVGPPGLALSHLHPRRGGLSLPTCSYTEEILQTLVACQSCRFTWDPTTVGGFICVPFKSQFHNERKKKQSTIGGKKSRFVAKRTSRFVKKKKSRFVTKKHHDS